MSDVAFAAEDTIESYYVDQVHARYQGHGDEEGFKQVFQELEKSIHELDLIIGEAKDKNGRKDQVSKSYVHVDSSVPPGETKMVGFEEELYRLMGSIRTQESSLQIIPIVGMAGIGKSALARSVYEHSYVKGKFDV